MMRCTKCSKEKEESDFYKIRNKIKRPCKECALKNQRKYYMKNDIHRKKCIEKVKKYALIHKVEKTKYKKQYYINNKNVISIKAKNNYLEHKKERHISSKAYRDKHKHEIKFKINKKVSTNRARNKKYKTDSLYKLLCILRSRITIAFKRKNFIKSNKSMELIGADIDFVKKYIERQFTKGMTWENYGHNGWEIDHIIPLSSAKTKEDLLRLFHYTNLQPLWHEENHIKNNKIPVVQLTLTI